MASLGSVTNLGVIKTQVRTKDAQLFQMPLPGSDSTSSLILDLFGVIGTISITGIYTGTSVSDAATFETTMEALSNGSQSRILYTSDTTKTYNVFVQKIECKKEEGSPLQVFWSAELIEGATL